MDSQPVTKEFTIWKGFSIALSICYMKSNDAVLKHDPTARISTANAWRGGLKGKWFSSLGGACFVRRGASPPPWQALLRPAILQHGRVGLELWVSFFFPDLKEIYIFMIISSFLSIGNIQNYSFPSIQWVQNKTKQNTSFGGLIQSCGNRRDKGVILLRASSKGWRLDLLSRALDNRHTWISGVRRSISTQMWTGWARETLPAVRFPWLYSEMRDSPGSSCLSRCHRSLVSLSSLGCTMRWEHCYWGADMKFLSDI